MPFTNLTNFKYKEKIVFPNFPIQKFQYTRDETESLIGLAEHNLQQVFKNLLDLFTSFVSQ